MKKLLASLLCVMMVLCMMPTMAFAVESSTVAVIGETEYASFADALTAANGMTGDVTVDIYGAVEFTNGMELKNGAYTSITFNGKSDTAKITINQSAGGDYLEAHGKTVAFNNLTLAKANPAWSGNSGHMGNYFSIQGGAATYTNCIFPNGACTSGGTATYNTCIFQNTSEYGLWVYDDAYVTVNGGAIESAKGIKVYSEDETTITSTLTVQNATFTENVSAKPAVAIGYAESITLIGNTYNNTTGVLELDSGSDADCEGITFVAQDASGDDISSTLTAVDRSNSNAACGVLMDGKIYTTVTTAAADATAGSDVTLLYNTDEAVELPEGVILDKNNYTADNVTVKQPVTYEVSTADELVAAITEINKYPDGNIVVNINESIDLSNVVWTPGMVHHPTGTVTVNGNGNTITGLTAPLFSGTWAGESGLIINDLTIADSNIVSDKDDAQGNVGVGAFIGYPQASEVITLNNCHLLNSTVEGGHWTGGLIGIAGGYSGNDGPVFMTLTIDGCSVKDSTIVGKGSVGGIIGHGACDAWTSVIITDCEVTGNTITSNDDSNIKAGAVLGTVGAAGSPATAAGETKTGGVEVSATVKDNTVTSNGVANTRIYGRFGNASGALTVTGGTYYDCTEADNAAPEGDVSGVTLTVNDAATFKDEIPVTPPPAPPAPSTGGSVTIQKPVITVDDGATADLSILGTTLTITAKEGYEIVDVTVNGVSKGAVTELKGLKTGDQVVVTTKLIEEETPADVQLVARSEMSSAKGKKAVKVYWFAEDGSDLTYDGYEIFRSVKRYEGYGKKPFFETEREAYWNTDIETGTKYFYKVRGYYEVNGERQYSDWSLKAWRTVE